MIEISNLSFSVSKKEILKDINIKIEHSNKIIGLFGPNGTGKTTFLNVLANYYQKYSGDVNMFEQSTFLLPDKEYILDNLTVSECLSSFQSLYATFNSERAEKMLLFLSLNTNKKIRTFSKGMKEQLHIVLALAQDVDIYLLDEPLAAVDPFNRDILMNLIENYRKENSLIIISTHLIDTIDPMIDEIIFMNNGQVICYENNQVLKDRYSTSLENIYKKEIKLCSH